MAKVSTTNDRSDSVKYAFMLFVFALLFVNVLIVAFVLHAVNVNSEYKTRFQFDNLKFESALYNAVSNYLDTCGVSPGSPSTVTNSASILPTVEIVEGCTWLTPRNYYRCMIEGVEYGINDFTPYGLIFQIGDGRIYCKRDADIIILRLKACERPARTALAGRADDEPLSVKGSYLHNSREENEN